MKKVILILGLCFGLYGYGLTIAGVECIPNNCNLRGANPEGISLQGADLRGTRFIKVSYSTINEPIFTNVLYNDATDFLGFDWISIQSLKA